MEKSSFDAKVRWDHGGGKARKRGTLQKARRTFTRVTKVHLESSYIFTQFWKNLGERNDHGGKFLNGVSVDKTYKVHMIQRGIK